MADLVMLHRRLERDLMLVRSLHHGLESSAEEHLLDRMEKLWWEMTQEARDRLNAEGPLPEVSVPLCGDRREIDLYVLSSSFAGPRQLQEV